MGCGISNLNDDGTLTKCEAEHSDVHQAPLLRKPVPPDGGGDHADDKARVVLEDWRLATARLFPQVAPRHLAFSLVCDIDPQHPWAMELAKSIVAPIHNLLPRGQLKECHIRLAKTPGEPLQQLAEDTVRHACGLPGLPGPTTPTMKRNLVTLPRELRLRILEYTDLVTPRAQVIWDRDEHAYSVRHFTPNPWYGPDEQHAGQFVGCWDAPYRDTGRKDLGHGCFCRRQHAAFSQGCKCWAPPGPTLFLLCRTLYHDAQFVFFSNHGFIVSDYRPRKWPVNTDPGPYVVSDLPDFPPPRERFAATEFLRHVPSSSLAYIRFLKITIPAYRPPSIWPQAQDPAMEDWNSTFEWARDKMSLPRLVIRFDVYGDQARRSYRITEAEAAAQVNTYMELLEPFKRLADGPSGGDGQGLGGFFASFAWPYRWVGDWLQDGVNAMWGGPDRREAEKQDQRAFELRARRYVMGDRYDPDATPPPVSDWDLTDG
ncbi:uncharacterized protein C8A04DRAFT_27076 [Dichotomopilus funicola]|uniref:Uncharacterized protein n=1 Tax=Dichotomopilus funicola TaxID=1934379 RepID=A0AAN6V5B6_9PEZI|nr:hypothetical protein C8A04DRAFT_27076 [Dichotomopilus funicola]